jgi:pimeloyl-ACP methyl ester carboxylesterase
VDALARTRRVVVYDCRGFGQSDVSDNPDEFRNRVNGWAAPERARGRTETRDRSFYLVLDSPAFAYP